MATDEARVHVWPSALLEGRLVRRYERFIAEVRVGSRVVRAHCVNPGRMEGLVVPGARVWLSEAARATRALPLTWELIELDGVLIGVNTILPNRLVRAVVERRLVSGLEDVSVVAAEQPLGRGHRVDLVLTRGAGPHAVEVKNCHLVYPDGFGYFPDSHSERAVKHVAALARLVKRGGRASVYFTVQRADAQGVRPSALHAPELARELRAAVRVGLEVRGLRFLPDLQGLRFDREVPVDVGRYDVGPLQGFSRALDIHSGWVRSDGRVAGKSACAP